MKSLADGLPPEFAKQIHPEWRKNEAAYWDVRETLLDQYHGQWIGFADGRVVASGIRPVVVFHARIGRRTIRFVFALDEKTSPSACAVPPLRLTPPIPANRCL